MQVSESFIYTATVAPLAARGARQRMVVLQITQWVCAGVLLLVLAAWVTWEFEPKPQGHWQARNADTLRYKQTRARRPHVTFHIAREFAPLVTYGGVSRVVAGIVGDGCKNDAASTSDNVSSAAVRRCPAVILPAYSFLAERVERELVLGSLEPATCGIPASRYQVFVASALSSYRVTGFQHRGLGVVGEGVCVYLVHAPESTSNAALSRMFFASTIADVYRLAAPGFTYMERNSFFAYASAGLIREHAAAVMRTAEECSPSEQPPLGCCAWGCVSVVVHGATNSAVAFELHATLPATARPPVMYIMHDYSSEFTVYTDLEHLLAKFSRVPAQGAAAAAGARGLRKRGIALFPSTCDCSQHEGLLRGFFASIGDAWESFKHARHDCSTACIRNTDAEQKGDISASVLGITYADDVVAVSRGMLSTLLGGWANAVAPAAVLSALRALHVENRLLGIPNSVDSALAPFAADVQGQPPQAAFIRGLKRAAKLRLCASEERVLAPLVAACTPWLLQRQRGDHSRGSARETRRSQSVGEGWDANAHEIEVTLEDMEPLLAVFFGRVEYIKGAEILPSIAAELCAQARKSAVTGAERGMSSPQSPATHLIHLLVYGPANVDKVGDSALAALRRLPRAPHGSDANGDGGDSNAARAAACSVTIISSSRERKATEADVRLAADVLLVPSVSESFGLVAAEGAAHGAVPVVSSVGGLLDVVTPSSAHAASLIEAARGGKDHKDDQHRIPRPTQSTSTSSVPVVTCAAAAAAEIEYALDHAGMHGDTMTSFRDGSWTGLLVPRPFECDREAMARMFVAAIHIAAQELRQQQHSIAPSRAERENENQGSMEAGNANCAGSGCGAGASLPLLERLVSSIPVWNARDGSAAAYSAVIQRAERRRLLGSSEMHPWPPPLRPPPPLAAGSSTRATLAFDVESEAAGPNMAPLSTHISPDRGGDPLPGWNRLEDGYAVQPVLVGGDVAAVAMTIRLLRRGSHKPPSGGIRDFVLATPREDTAFIVSAWASVPRGRRGRAALACDVYYAEGRPEFAISAPFSIADGTSDVAGGDSFQLTHAWARAELFLIPPFLAGSAPTNRSAPLPTLLRRRAITRLTVWLEFSAQPTAEATFADVQVRAISPINVSAT